MIESMTNQLEQVLRECLGNIQDEIEVSPALLAHCAVKILDPDGNSPALVEWGCNLQLRQLSRQILRREYDPVDRAVDQQELFAGLQQRYPVERGGEHVYVPRMAQTLEERRKNEDRMYKSADGLISHADKHKAETDMLEATGFFAEGGIAGTVNRLLGGDSLL